MLVFLCHSNDEEFAPVDLTPGEGDLDYYDLNSLVVVYV